MSKNDKVTIHLVGGPSAGEAVSVDYIGNGELRVPYSTALTTDGIVHGDTCEMTCYTYKIEVFICNNRKFYFGVEHGIEPLSILAALWSVYSESKAQ